MVSKWSVAVAVACTFASGFELHAQSCIGQSALDEVHVNGGVDVRMVSQGNGMEGRLGFGNARAFGSAMAGSVLYKKGEKMRSYIGGMDGGYSVKLGSRGPRMCPMVSVFYENGPQNAAIKYTEFRAFAGVSLGGAAPLSESASLVSFVAGGFKETRYTSKLFNTPTSDHSTAHDPQIMGGTGLQLKQLLTRLVVVLPSALRDNRGDAPAYFIVGFTITPKQMSQK